MANGKRKNATEAVEPHFQREEIAWLGPRPAPYHREGQGQLKWRPNVDYCANGTGWAHGTYLEALNPESRYRSICLTCRVWRREPLLGWQEQRRLHWRACHHPDGSRRSSEEAAELVKRIPEIRPSAACATCGQRWTVVDARFEAPPQGKPEKEWRRRYEAWLELPGARQLAAQFGTHDEEFE